MWQMECGKAERLYRKERGDVAMADSEEAETHKAAGSNGVGQAARLYQEEDARVRGRLYYMK